MHLFDVYPLYDIEPVSAQGSYVRDSQGNTYLDFYGGHAVISIGHTHPHYTTAITEQLHKIGFYSNFIQNPLQSVLAEKLGKASGYEDYALFLCNSGAEAIENALKIASFHTGKKQVVAFCRAFHGRTSAAVEITENPAIQAPINQNGNAIFLPFNHAEAVEYALQEFDVAAVIVEGIQGVGGIHVADTTFLQEVRQLCNKYGAVMILDEIQSGYGRSGKFFAHQWAAIQPDLITVAKGMGNGFPVGGLLLHPQFKAKHGLLGTTFGGNHLACAAAIAVLEVIEKERLVENAYEMGEYLKKQLIQIKNVIEVRGRGLMLGVGFDKPVAEIRKKLLFEQYVFTGSSADKYTIRLLPPLSLTKQEVDLLVEKLKIVAEN
jgi:acetylornithine aminotransferase